MPFVKALALPKHPPVIFLDDLQWADAASLHLMRLLLDEAGSAALLVIGAYRDNEVTVTHPLRATIADLNQAGAAVTTRSLTPLSPDGMNQLIADALSCPIAGAPIHAAGLSENARQPVFTTQLLHALHDERLLTFNGELGQW